MEKNAQSVNEKEVLKRGYAKNLDEWWFLVTHYWGDLLGFLQRLGPEKLVGAKRAFENKEARNMHGYLHKAWEALPDHPSIHAMPGFYSLCDLCSDFPYEDLLDESKES